MSSVTTDGKTLPTLKKHISSKHMEQRCKICGKMFETSMKIVSYVAIEQGIAKHTHCRQELKFSVP